MPSAIPCRTLPHPAASPPTPSGTQKTDRAEVVLRPAGLSSVCLSPRKARILSRYRPATTGSSPVALGVPGRFPYSCQLAS